MYTLPNSVSENRQWDTCPTRLRIGHSKATELQTSQSDGLHQNVCLPEWCIIYYRLTSFYDKPKLLSQTLNIMTNPNYCDSHIYYDSQDKVSPNYGHHDCTVLYSLYNLKCEHRNRTLPNYYKCYAYLLIAPCYEKKTLLC